MKKIIIGLIALIAIIAIGSLIFLSKVDGLILQAIEEEGTKALGVAVKVTSVETDLKQGSATINGLSIANPTGYQKPFAFQINNFSTQVDYKNKDIAEILIDKPIIAAEIKGTKNNFQDLLDNMPESDETTSEAESQDGDDIELSIQAIKIRQATVNVTSDVLGEQQFMMDDLTLNNLTGTPEQLAEQVTEDLTKHISNQLKRFARKRVEDEVKQQIKDKVNETLNDKVGDKIGSQLGDKLKGLKFKLK